MDKLHVLFASRAFESPHTEGGFLLLRDLAVRAATDATMAPAVFSTKSEPRLEDSVRRIYSITKTGWGVQQAAQFTCAIASVAAEFDLVHTAHVPTPINSNVLRYLRSRRGRRRVKYLQTVTALPSEGRIRKGLFWADAITCINPGLTEVVAKYHANVRTIPPIPRPERLTSRPRMPRELSDRLRGRQVVSVPIIASRMSRSFPLVPLCERLVNADEHLQLVFACRFGEERVVQGWLNPLIEAYRNNVIVVGTVDWILDLFSLSKVVLYPMGDLEKKFNPPLVLLEAAQLGAGIVATPYVCLDGLIDAAAMRTVCSDSTEEWFDAITGALASTGARSLIVPFDDVYESYKALYNELLA